MASISPYNPYCFPGVTIQLHNNNTLHMPTITNYIPGCRLTMATWDSQASALICLAELFFLTAPPLLFNQSAVQIDFDSTGP